MTDSRRPYGAEQPAEIDDLEDRSGSVEPLNFEDDEVHESISDLFTDEERAQHMAGQPSRRTELSGGALPDEDLDAGFGDDDLEQEMLIREDGARDAKEAPQRAAMKRQTGVYAWSTKTKSGPVKGWMRRSWRILIRWVVSANTTTKEFAGCDRLP